MRDLPFVQPQRATETHEELTEGMEMKGDSHAGSQLRS